MSLCGLILLAAGDSSRMGTAKQLLPFNNKNLLQHSLDIAEASAANPIIAVLGANVSTVRAGVNTENTQFVFNNNWEDGIASSIRVGLSELVELYPYIDSVIFMVCDQPYVSAPLLNGLITKRYLSGKDMVASSYGGILGTPVLFGKKYFDTLLNLKGDEGAKKIIKANMHSIAKVSFPMGYLDIDTQTDYDLLNVLNSKSALGFATNLN